jgi:hypothetical protein
MSESMLVRMAQSTGVPVVILDPTSFDDRMMNDRDIG